MPFIHFSWGNNVCWQPCVHYQSQSFWMKATSIMYHLQRLTTYIQAGSQFDEDLVAICSVVYCHHTQKGQQKHWFSYPKPLQPQSTIVMEEEPILLTVQNDGMDNSFNPVQLSAWHDSHMQYIVSESEWILHQVHTSPRVSHSRSHWKKCTPKSYFVVLREGTTSLKVYSAEANQHCRSKTLLC